MRYKSVCPPEHCTACMACVASCTHSSIEITKNSIGFLYPRIDVEKCTDCGLCRTSCPEINRQALVFPKKAYAAAMKDDEIYSVASGGTATVMAKKIIRDGGIVVGCSGEDFHDVRHRIVETMKDLETIKGSKYVQSRISPGLYAEIREMLIADRKVLFIGTGCQVAGIRNYLRKEYSNLTTVDLVCHGVPSQEMLDMNMELYSDMDPASVRFRDKYIKPDGTRAIRFGWIYQSIHTGEKHYVPVEKDPYMSAFLGCISFRESCYDCRYAYVSRQSDITVADFWGLSGDSRLKGRPGVSLILVNTDRGRELLDSCRDSLDVEERPISEAVRGNDQLQAPCAVTEKRIRFLRLLPDLGWKRSVERSLYPHRKLKKIIGIPYRCLRKAYSLLPH